MSEELREMIKNLGLTSEQCTPDRLEELIKQWAKGCVGDELKDYQSFSQLGVNLSFNKGYNQCRAETLKKIEEGE
jgi:hypothetical protein